MNSMNTRSSVSAAPATYSIVAVCAIFQLLSIAGMSAPINEWLVFTPYMGVVQPWRLVTAGFLHGGIFHLLLNMVALVMCGRQLESTLGGIRFAVVWLLSTTGSYLVAVLLALTGLSIMDGYSAVGASGGIFGLFAIMLMIQRSVGAETRGLMIFLGMMMVYDIVASGIAWQVHLGGIVIGLLIGWVIVAAAKRQPKPDIPYGYAAIGTVEAREEAARQRRHALDTGFAALAAVEVAAWAGTALYLGVL